jgi:hypothetical protein
MLVTQSALVMRRIGIDRCGPLKTVVVPWTILQASSKLTAATRSAQAQACAGGVRWGCALVTSHLWSASPVEVVTRLTVISIQALHAGQ